jgi:hypothetical protein
VHFFDIARHLDVVARRLLAERELVRDISGKVPSGEVQRDQSDDCREDTKSIGSVGGGTMSLRRSANRDRLSRPMGLARSFQCDQACTRLRLRDLRWQLAQAVSGDQGPGKNHTLSG